MLTKAGIVALAVLLGFTVSAEADWSLVEPAKWVQLPDLGVTGIDVSASDGFILADDFQCTESGYITAVHLWGSWKSDDLPFGRYPDSVSFVVRFHSDIPDSESPTGYSMPDSPWFESGFAPGQYTVQIWRRGIDEGWMDPPDDYIFPGDHICYQYNFVWTVPLCVQDGSPDDPRTYWVSIEATPLDSAAHFGWKTSLAGWNDDAVWALNDTGPWFELRYPPGHPEVGSSIDLAFVIEGEPFTDWGDAPDDGTGTGYPTLASSNGARHIIQGPHFGDISDSPDHTWDGAPDPNALGDDNDGNDDEDGVQIPVLVQGQTETINFEVYYGGFVDAWIDFNRNGVWEEPGERICSGSWRPPGFHGVNVTPPVGTLAGKTFARFRINTTASLPPGGAADDGEVEDYVVFIERQQTYKWIQRPDLTATGIDVQATSTFILADDYLCTEAGKITEIWVWGSWLNDYYGASPQAVQFILSFHGDIPVGPDGHSVPGEVLWNRLFHAGEFNAVVYADSIDEGWMEPPEEYWFPADHTCWLYKFLVPLDEAFFQRGSLLDPIVYWLNVQAFPYDQSAIFGWKTSREHWNDAAVWGLGSEPYPGPWLELIYPPGHEMYGDLIDLAFRLTTDPLSDVPGGDGVPDGFGLHRNVPNPFRAKTTIRYNLPESGHVRLEVYDVTGRLVRTLVDEAHPRGIHIATWEGSDSRNEQVPPGIYFCRLTSGQKSAIQKMLFLK